MKKLDEELELDLFRKFLSENFATMLKQYDSGNVMATIVYKSMFGAWLGAKAQAVPDGCAIVPVKATDWQRVNVRDFDPDICDYELMGKHDWEDLCARIYEKMVEAYEDERP